MTFIRRSPWRRGCTAASAARRRATICRERFPSCIARGRRAVAQPPAPAGTGRSARCPTPRGAAGTDGDRLGDRRVDRPAARRLRGGRGNPNMKPISARCSASSTHSGRTCAHRLVHVQELGLGDRGVEEVVGERGHREPRAPRSSPRNSRRLIGRMTTSTSASRGSPRPARIGDGEVVVHPGESSARAAGTRRRRSGPASRRGCRVRGRTAARRRGASRGGTAARCCRPSARPPARPCSRNRRTACGSSVVPASASTVA